ncbi:P-loop containing nucleoside triphosphate hydrolase protein [Scleroderma citrinum]
MVRILCSVVTSVIQWVSNKTAETYKTRIKYHMEGKLFEAKLSQDLSTSTSSRSREDSDAVVQCFEHALYLVQALISSLFQLRLVVHIIDTSIQHSGLTFALLYLIPIFTDSMFSQDLWGKQFVAQVINKAYLRKSALLEFAKDGFKAEVISAGITEYLLEEYRNAKHDLGDTPDSQPEILYRPSRFSLMSEIFSRLCPQAVMLYVALVALFNPSKISLAQLAVLEQTNVSIRQTFSVLFFWAEKLPQDVTTMSNFYKTLDAKPEMKDGSVSYPQPGYDKGIGMSVEFRNVSFNYPSTKTDRSALSDISFTIQPGHLVVIVGSNGSGKTTIIKLLSRFYDVDAGTILIDGIPIQEYRIKELRKGIAILTQEHNLFPSSIQENVALGSPDKTATKNREKLRESLILSGADRVVDNFSEGMDTVLEPVSNGFVSFSGHGNEELEAIYDSFSKPASVSGGEKQRLVAARTFMRLLTTPVQLVTVDEPSSALDPAGEFKLFSHLREARNGRTMIFVTHRFGHLTKHADLIICVKDGKVVETGTHSELLAVDGEYAHLYNVQAQAFSSTT